MSSTIVMINLFGAVALLLFCLAQVKDGVSRAFDAKLRTGLATGTRCGLCSLVSGFFATVALQTSTVTALMVASFVERELVKPRRAQIVARRQCWHRRHRLDRCNRHRMAFAPRDPRWHRALSQRLDLRSGWRHRADRHPPDAAVAASAQATMPEQITGQPSPRSLRPANSTLSIRRPT